MKPFLLVILITSSFGCATTAPPAIVEQHEQVNLSDGEFAHLMTTHHLMVMDIALLARGSGKSPELKAIATKIWESRQRDLPAWEAFAKLAPKISEIAGSHEREMTASHRSVMTRMKAADPGELDELFIEEMQRLGEVALTMIKQTQLRDPGVKQLADRVTQAQRAELEQLNQLRPPSVARGTQSGHPRR